MPAPTAITAIQCPKCGSTQKAEIRPGDFRCASCGTEYFIDNGTVSFSPPPLPPQIIQTSTARPVSAFSIMIFACLITLIIIVVFIFYSMSSTSSPANTNTAGTGSDYTWQYSWGGEHLYLSTDKRPIELTLGTKTHPGDNSKSKDYIAFYDIGEGAELKLLPMPGTSLMTHEHGNTDIDLREFSNGDIYILSDKEVISRVTKASLSVEDVTQSLFKDQPELVSGIAKVEFVDDEYEKGNGFNLFTNDGKNYFYFPLINRLYIKETLTQLPSDIKIALNSVQKTGFDFSRQCDYDHTELGAQLVTYQYLGRKNAPVILIPLYSPFRWDDEQSLKQNGVLSHADFTPGRNYYEQRILYFDDDYVLICYKPTPSNSAIRYLQCLNARNAAILFTTPLDGDYPPDQCVRYKDGFAMVNAGISYAATFSGKITQYTPNMYKTN